MEQKIQGLNPDFYLALVKLDKTSNLFYAKIALWSSFKLEKERKWKVYL